MRIAGAQATRAYVFVGPAPNNGGSSQASFGILPTPPPLVPPANNTYAAGLGLEERFNSVASGTGVVSVLGAGIELAGILPGGGKVLNNSVGVVSPNAYFHWPWRDGQDAKLNFYATAGYSIAFRDFTANGFNAGGGMYYWFGERLGLNVEFRVLKLFGSVPATADTRYYQIRFGLTFR